MATENPTWGEERISDELSLKLGIRVSPRTVAKYRQTGPARQTDPKQRWLTFVRNHAKAIVACDFFVVVTASFRLLYVFVVLEQGTRRVLHTTSLTTRRRTGRRHDHQLLPIASEPISLRMLCSNIPK
jgi:hypothetical protein